MVELSKIPGDYVVAQGTGGVQSGGQDLAVQGGVDPVVLTGEGFKDQGFGISPNIPFAFNLTLGGQLPVYLGGEAGHRHGFSVSGGLSLSKVTKYSLFSDAYGDWHEGEDKPADDAARAAYTLTAEEGFVGGAFGVSYIHETTTDVTKLEKAVADAKKAQDEGKKAVKTAEAAVAEAKKALAPLEATLAQKKAALEIAQLKVGVVRIRSVAGTGLLGEQEDLQSQIDEEDQYVNDLPEGNSSEKRAKAEARTQADIAIATIRKQLDQVEAKLKEAQAALDVATLDFKAAAEAVRVGTIPVDAAKAEVTKAENALKGDASKRPAAEEKLAAAKAVKTAAETALRSNPSDAALKTASEEAVKAVDEAQKKLDALITVADAKAALAAAKDAKKDAEEASNANPQDAALKEAFTEAKKAVKAAQKALDEALGLNGVVEAAEAALEAAKDKNDAFTVSRAGLRFAWESGTTQFHTAAGGIDVTRMYNATLDDVSTHRFNFDGELAMNLPSVPFDLLLQVGGTVYGAMPNTPAVHVKESDKSDNMSAPGNVEGHFALGLEF